MGVPDFLHLLSRRGFRVWTEGDRLMVAPRARLTEELRQMIREHRSEIFAALGEAQREAYEERAAIIEYDGGMRRGDAERAAWAIVYGSRLVH